MQIAQIRPETALGSIVYCRRDTVLATLDTVRTRLGAFKPIADFDWDWPETRTTSRRFLMQIMKRYPVN
jgi:hypothetical protein